LLTANTRSAPIPFPRTIAVTGATGLIGRRLLPALHATGSQLRVLTHNNATFVPADEIRGDLLDSTALLSLTTGADAVVHLAAMAHTSLRTKADRAAARRINVDGTRLLLRAALDAGVSHFILISSAHVYAGQHGEDLDESSPTAPDTPYGALKLEAEALALEAQKEGLAVTILRPCLTYGPGVRFNLQNLLRAIHRGLYVQAKGVRTVRSMASVDTVSAAILHLLARPQANGIFNVADQHPIELEPWVNHLADAMHVKHPQAVSPTILNALAAIGSAAATIGLPAPITRDSLRKLTTSFSLSTRKLAAVGFHWPPTQDQVIAQMIEAEFGQPSAE
jgi:nucleoside-diphosphate-sugar epimerase